MGNALITEDALGVFWSGEEQPGIMVYSYWQGQCPADVSPTVSVWPAGSQWKSYHLADVSQYPPAWTVLEWAIVLPTWPPAAQWLTLLRAELTGLCDRGAIVAWCGLEGHFADPPSLFLAEEMTGGVWASYSPELGFHCAANLGEPFAALDDGHLAQLRAQIMPK